MKIPKAIELNKESEKSLRDHKFIDYADAVKLGSEALKQIDYLHVTNVLGDDELLPGETPEIDTKRSLHHIKEILESPEVRK